MHLIDDVTKDLQKQNVDQAVIPSEMTPVLQPVVIRVNKALKHVVKLLWNQWIVSGKVELTKGRKRRAPFQGISY